MWLQFLYNYTSTSLLFCLYFTNTVLTHYILSTLWSSMTFNWWHATQGKQYLTTNGVMQHVIPLMF